MELLLALAVITAVIIFGALISLANERQRKAIDNLREQVVLWAVQDLRLKREEVARNVRIDDPMNWLNTILKRTCNIDETLHVDRVHDDPSALVCTSLSGKTKITLTPYSPTQVRQMRKTGRNRILQSTIRNPLFDLSRKVNAHEISLLNGGLLFDIELPIAWKSLTNQEMGQMDRIWAYRIV